MKQYRITSADLNPSSDDDCYLAPDDPIHQLKAVSMMGGLGSEAALAQYNSLQKPQIQGSDKGRVAREQKIEPGTDAWFKHWFGGAR
jgi:hypothetical protein